MDIGKLETNHILENIDTNSIILNKEYTTENPLCILKLNTTEIILNKRYEAVGLPKYLDITEEGFVIGLLKTSFTEYIDILFVVTYMIDKLQKIVYQKKRFSIINEDLKVNEKLDITDRTNQLETNTDRTNQLETNTDRTNQLETNTDRTNQLETNTDRTNQLETNIDIDNKLDITCLKGVWDLLWTIDNINETHCAVCRAVIKFQDMELRDMKVENISINNVIGSLYGEENWPPIWLTVSEIHNIIFKEQYTNKLINNWPNKVFDYGIHNFKNENNLLEWSLTAPKPYEILTNKRFFDVELIDNDTIQGKVVDSNYPLDANNNKFRLFKGKRVTDYNEIKKLTVFSFFREI